MVMGASDNGTGYVVIEYSTSEVSALTEKLDAAEEGRIASDSYDGPIGLHYTSANGRDYLVPNVFELGPPISLDSHRDSEKTRSLQQLSGESQIRMIPKEATLLASYPNPFNPMCTIRYELPISARVTLQVFDISGSPVRTLVNGWREPGVYNETWDGKRDDGSTLSSGVYFYSIKAGDFVATRKTVLLR